MKPVVQEHAMGCAIACVASLLGINYSSALKLFRDRERVMLKGTYCRDVCSALFKAGKKYSYAKVNSKTAACLKNPGTIVFIKRSKKYPIGHYLLKTNKGWMNPWINLPMVNPAKAGYSRRLPGKSQWVIYSPISANS